MCFEALFNNYFIPSLMIFNHYNCDSVVRKYGNSTSGEQWDLTVNQERFVRRKVQHTWKKIMSNCNQLMGIDKPQKTPDIS